MGGDRHLSFNLVGGGGSVVGIELAPIEYLLNIVIWEGSIGPTRFRVKSVQSNYIRQHLNDRTNRYKIIKGFFLC